MDSCLTAPSHCLRLCWLIISKVPWHASQGIIIKISEGSNQYNKIRNCILNSHPDLPRANNNELTPGGWFNIKTSYQYRKSHCGDKTILRPSYLHNGISYTGKMLSLYWTRTLLFLTTLASRYPLLLHESHHQKSHPTLPQGRGCVQWSTTRTIPGIRNRPTLGRLR